MYHLEFHCCFHLKLIDLFQLHIQIWHNIISYLFIILISKINLKYKEMKKGLDNFLNLIYLFIFRIIFYLYIIDYLFFLVPVIILRLLYFQPFQYSCRDNMVNIMNRLQKIYFDFFKKINLVSFNLI